MVRVAVNCCCCVFSMLVSYIATVNGLSEDIGRVVVDVGIPHTGHQMRLSDKKQLNALDRILEHGAVSKITLAVSLLSSNEQYTFHLVSSPLILPKQLKVTYFDNSTHNSEPIYRYIDVKKFSCFYADSEIVGQHLSLFELCNSQFDGEVTLHTGQTFRIRMVEDANGALSFLMLKKEQMISPGKCGNKNPLHHFIANNTLHRTVRSAKLAHAPYQRNDATRYLELYVVVAHQLYVRSGNDLDKTVERVLNIVNYASSLFRQMNIYLALVGAEVWTDVNKFSVTGKAGDVLEQFEMYRMNDINPKTRNDNANLFVADRFADATVGQGSVSMCVNLGGAAITADHYDYDWITSATTMVHELGHNLGLVHDDELPNASECVCPRADVDDDKCIMYSASGAIQPIAWSKCSIEAVQNSFTNRGTDYCLKNLPDSLTLVSSCGNYFVDENEECDCGPSDQCESKCCEPLTCQFINGSQCATGECCDKETCRLKNAATGCRETLDSFCDLPEYCDGTSEWCPANTYKSNGMPCSEEMLAYCYEGHCKSRDTQCVEVWGEKSKSGIDECYTKWNTAGEYYGNCGYTIMYANNTPIYKKCQPEDSMCGMLQCESANDDGVLGLYMHLEYFNSYVSYEGRRFSCKIVTFDVGLDVANPGLVPEGAACGEGGWCMEQKCVDKPMLPDYCNCSGQGQCNQYNECHCDDGFDPSDNCTSAGSGGSIRSGPQSIYLVPTTTTTTPPPKNNSWVTPLVVILVLLLVIAAVVVLVVFRRRQLMMYWKERKPNFRRRYQAKTSTKTTSQTKSKEAKLSSLSDTNTRSSRRHDYISNPILESTTNQTMNLRDIPGAALSLDPVSNPTYDSQAIIDNEESAPLTSIEERGHTYSECQFDSDSDSEEVNAYEDIPVDIEHG